MNQILKHLKLLFLFLFYSVVIKIKGNFLSKLSYNTKLHNWGYE